jgi:hypothetical protein
MRSSASTVIGPYANEYCIFFDFNEDGTKVTKMMLTIDSGYSGPFFGRLMEYVEKQKQGAASS